MKKSTTQWRYVNKLKVLFTLVAVIFLLTACKEQRYLVVVFNNSEQNIEKVTLWLEDQSFEYGTIKTNSKETGIFEQHRLSPLIKITWNDSNNKEFEQEFATFDFIPKNYANGRVYLKFQNNHFELSFDDASF